MSSTLQSDYRAPVRELLSGHNISTSNWHVSAVKETRYDAVVSKGLLDPANPTLAAGMEIESGGSARRLFVVDETVHGLYGNALRAYCTAWDIEAVFITIHGDEGHKSLENAVAVTKAMSEAGLNRRSQAVVGVGGGVVLDVVGLAASLYRRGIPYIRVPTTLMGIVDAGIGIKTGVNLDLHKNRIGSYYAPKATYLDPTFCRSLSQRHIANGVAEIVKMALVKDRRLFEILSDEVDRLTPEYVADANEGMSEILNRAIGGMLDELEPNLWEAELERCVDYGHTFSPALELVADPALLHGEAVAIDMAFSLGLALARNLITTGEAARALDVIKSAGLPIHHPMLDIKLAEKALADTILHRDGLQRVPLTNQIGDCVFVNDLNREDLTDALDWLRSRASEPRRMEA